MALSNPNKRLLGRVAVVTGAAGGVGSAIALALANEGADLALIDIRAGLIRTIAKKCAEPDVKAIGYKVDFFRDAEIKIVKKKVMREFGGVDILVHSAGLITLSNVACAHLSSFCRQCQCNVRAPFALTQLLLPTLIERQGQIVSLIQPPG